MPINFSHVGIGTRHHGSIMEIGVCKKASPGFMQQLTVNQRGAPLGPIIFEMAENETIVFIF